MKKYIVALFGSVALAFLVITIRRAMVAYSVNGVYFDGDVSYDSDAVVAYGAITIAFAALAVAFLPWRRRPINPTRS